MTTTLTLSEQALRGQLAGQPLTIEQIAELMVGRESDRYGPICGRLYKACKAGEIPAVAESYPHLVPGLVCVIGPSGLRGDLCKVIEGIRYWIGPSEFAALPKSLADDLPLIGSSPTLMAWVGTEKAPATSRVRRTAAMAVPEGAFKAKVLAKRLQPFCTRAKLYDDLNRGDGPFKFAKVPGLDGYFFEKPIIDWLKAHDQYREQPQSASLQLASGNRR